MSGIDPNRNGTNSTELMQKSFEDSGYVEKGQGQKLAWHQGLETYEQANEARKNDVDSRDPCTTAQIAVRG